MASEGLAHPGIEQAVCHESCAQWKRCAASDWRHGREGPRSRGRYSCGVGATGRAARPRAGLHRDHTRRRRARERPAAKESGRDGRLTQGPVARWLQLLVTECVFNPLFVQVTVPPVTTETDVGEKELSPMVAAALAGWPLPTVTEPVIPPWNLQW